MSDIIEELSLRTGTKGAEILDEAEGIVEAFVSGIGNKDSVGDIVEPGAFGKSLERRHPRVIWSHDWNHPVGKVLDIYEVGPSDARLPEKMKKAGIGGLYAKVQFNLLSEKGREAFASVAFYGNDQEWSIGYKTLRSKFDPMVKANRLQEVELFEVSPVLHGANQLTGTVSVKNADIVEDKNVDSIEFQPVVSDGSFDAKSMDGKSTITAVLSHMMGGAEVNIVLHESDRIVFSAGGRTWMMNLERREGRMWFTLPMPVTLNVEPEMDHKEDEEYEEEVDHVAPVAPTPPPRGMMVIKVDGDIDLDSLEMLKALKVKIYGNEIHFLSVEGETMLKKMVADTLRLAGVTSLNAWRT